VRWLLDRFVNWLTHGALARGEVTYERRGTSLTITPTHRPCGKGCP
jgi:hypothetical protein